MSYNMKIGYNIDIVSQIEVLDQIIRSNEIIYKVIECANLLDLEHYYIGGGCITQTVWNYLSGNDLLYGINDVDFVYFDDEHLDYDDENKVIDKIHELFPDIGIEVDVKNEARVHLWYESHNGYNIKPYKSLEDAINTWPTTATTVGVRLENNQFKVYAPFGLNDMFGKIVKANKVQITKQIYENKVEKWIKKWPDLKVIPWDK
ncbi:nucleotidyltransferase family protein [Anaerosporobacter sp.]